MSKHKKEMVDLSTGEITEQPAKLNEVIKITTIRPNGRRRIQSDYSNCPTMAEQHTAHLTNLNYLIEKYKPDELAAYIAARGQYKREILGHDFSQEPSLQDANNIIYRSKQEFEELPLEVRQNFRNHLEFLKFIDNPANAEKMLRMGILTLRQIETIQMKENDNTSPTPTPTKEKETEKK